MHKYLELIKKSKEETKYKLNDLISGISKDKRKNIENYLKINGVDINTITLDNPFEILKYKDEYGNDILTIRDIAYNIKLENKKQINDFLTYVIDTYFNDTAKDSYYYTSNFFDGLVKREMMLNDNQFIKVGDYITFEGLSEEGKVSKLIEIYGRQDFLYDSEKGIICTEKQGKKEAYIAKILCQLKSANNQVFDIDLSSTELDETQRSSIEAMLKSKSNVGMILAAGGTGKTKTIIDTVIAISNIHPEWEIAVLAPTGKAACNIQSTNYGENVNTESIHAFIGWKCQINDAFVKNKIRNTKIIIIDEASMVSYDVLYYLLKSVDVNNTKVIIIGDEYQLRAVGTGNLISDCKILGIESREFTKDYRTQTHLLTANYDFVRSLFKDKSRIVENKPYLGLEENERFHIHPFSECEEFIEHKYDAKDFNSIMVTHQNKLKQDINDKINKSSHTADEQPLYSDFYVGDKIIINENKRNGSKYYYVNGDTGVVVGDGVDEDDCGYLLIRLYPETDREIEKRVYYSDVDRDVISHADCITVNKSQGSQWNKVVVIIPDNDNISLNLFYTAISRARTNVDLFVNRETLVKVLLQNPEEKRTLIGIIKEEFIDKEKDYLNAYNEE